MSLILEALRKSEAERRRGLPPDLHAELPPVPARRARTVPMWAWPALGIGALALTAWLLLKPRPSGTVPAPTVEAAQALPSQGPQVLPAPTAPSPLPQIAPAPAPPMAQTAPATPSEPPTSPQPPIPERAPPAPPTSVAPSPPATAAAPRPPATPAEPGRVLGLGELDAGAREALPPLRMSMHLWNENPAQRFAIIDGRRVTEGDAIGEVRVVRIERDGVLLEWQGRGIRLPVR